jgi:hypothetical protein
MNLLLKDNLLDRLQHFQQVWARAKHGIHQIVTNYKKSSFAYVSTEGKILKSRNFPWEIKKETSSDDNLPSYVIMGRYGDSSEVNAQPDGRIKTEVYNAMSGIAVKFFCKPEEMTNFEIKINP